MSANLRYRLILFFALVGVCMGIITGLGWAYVLCSFELGEHRPKVISSLLFTLVLTGACLSMARFAKKRIGTAGPAN